MTTDQQTDRFAGVSFSPDEAKEKLREITELEFSLSQKRAEFLRDARLSLIDDSDYFHAGLATLMFSQKA